MLSFTQKIKIIGVNPYVVPPTNLLKIIFEAAGKDKGPIPIKIKIEGKEFMQHLVKYSGLWRLYLNEPMRSHAGKELGDVLSLEIAYDPIKRESPTNALFESALSKSKKAKFVFENSPPYLQKEIVRYINSLKSLEAIERNVVRAIKFLEGKERFVGRDPIKIKK